MIRSPWFLCLSGEWIFCSMKQGTLGRSHWRHRLDTAWTAVMITVAATSRSEFGEPDLARSWQAILTWNHDQDPFATFDLLIAVVEASSGGINCDRKTGSDNEELHRWSRMAKEARQWHESTSTDRRVTGRRLQRQIIKQHQYSYSSPGCRTPEIIFGSNLLPEDQALYGATYTLMFLGKLAEEINRTNRSAARQILEVRTIAEGVSKCLLNGSWPYLVRTR